MRRKKWRKRIWNEKISERSFHTDFYHYSIPAFCSFIFNENSIIQKCKKSSLKYLTAANVDHPIARDENMIPKRPFIFTKMDSPAKPMTGSKQYPN